MYYQRDKRRAQLLKESQSTDSNPKYSEPPELLKSNSTPGTSIHQSNSMCSQTTQQHFDSYSLASASSQQQLSSTGVSTQHHRGILLSPQQAHAHSSNHHHPHYASQMLGVATLHRSNGGLGMTTLPKPPPPPRSISNFSTLPHKGGPHVCHSHIPGSNSSQKLTPFDELNV